MTLVSHLADLAPLLGDWSGTEQLEASPWMAGGPAHGTWRLAADAGGTIVVQQYAQRRDGEQAASFTAHGVIGASPDGTVSPLLSWWFDSFGFPPVPAAEATVDGGALVVTKRTERGTSITRLWLEDGALHQTIDLQLAGAEAPARLIQGRYERA